MKKKRSKIQEPLSSEAINKLQCRIGYFFQNCSILLEALTHPSYRKSNTNYQRLEFLGDTVVSLAVAEFLYKKYDDLNEGGLSVILAHMVQTSAMAYIAKLISLGDYLIMNGGEETTGGRENPHNLENALEALIGAIHIDGGFTAAKEIVECLWHHLLSIPIEQISEKNHKSQLQEWAQQRGYDIPHYTMIGFKGQPHTPLFHVSVKVGLFPHAYAEGKSRKEAEQLAAKVLLEVIKTSTSKQAK